MLDVKHRPYAEKWPRMRSQPRTHTTPYGPDLFLGNGWHIAGPHDADDNLLTRFLSSVLF